MADSPEPNNNRVTLAIINTNLLHLTEEVKDLRVEVCQKQADHETRLRSVENWCSTTVERWTRHDREHADLNAKKWTADVIGTIAAALAGIFVKSPLS